MATSLLVRITTALTLARIIKALLLALPVEMIRMPLVVMEREEHLVALHFPAAIRTQRVMLGVVATLAVALQEYLISPI